MCCGAFWSGLPTSFLDGRDTPPKSALSGLGKFRDLFNTYPKIAIASICGRYYAMDRDKRFERVEPIYKIID